MDPTVDIESADLIVRSGEHAEHRTTVRLAGPHTAPIRLAGLLSPGDDPGVFYEVGHLVRLDADRRPGRRAEIQAVVARIWPVFEAAAAGAPILIQCAPGHTRLWRRALAALGATVEVLQTGVRYRGDVGPSGDDDRILIVTRPRDPPRRISP